MVWSRVFYGHCLGGGYPRVQKISINFEIKGKILRHKIILSRGLNLVSSSTQHTCANNTCVEHRPCVQVKGSNGTGATQRGPCFGGTVDRV